MTIEKKKLPIKEGMEKPCFPKLNANKFHYILCIEPVTRQMCVQIRSMDQFEKLVEINIRSVSYQRDTIPVAYDS